MCIWKKIIRILNKKGICNRQKLWNTVYNANIRECIKEKNILMYKGKNVSFMMHKEMCIIRE